MRYLRLFLRLLRYTIYVVLAFAIGAVAVLTLTERGRDNLAGLISDFSSSPGRTVTLSGIDGIWSGHLTLQGLVLEDARGPWLVARAIEVDWSPLALFSAAFRAERIFAERIELARLPESESAAKDDGAASLPLSLSLKQIDLPDIALGPELAGGVAAISAKGSLVADASPVQVETDFRLARTDGPAGEADGAIRFVPNENVLDINVRASEPAGGIIANLLKLPDAPPVELAVMGSGPAGDWRASATFAVDGVVVTRAEGRHQFTDRGSAIEAKGDGEFDRFVPEMLRPLLSGRTVFDIAGVATTAGGVDIERATIESNAVKGTASGTLDPEGVSAFTLRIDAAGEGVPLSFGTRDSPIDMVVQSASVRAVGDGREPNLDITASLSKVATNDAELNDLAIALYSDAFNIESRTGPVTGTATAAALIIDNPTIAPLVAGRISAGIAGMLSTDSLTVTDGNLDSDALAGKFTGDVSLADGSVTLDLKADVASAALPSSIRPALAERVDLTASIVRDTEGHVSADPFSISSGGISARGRIAAANSAIEASVEGAIANIGVVAKGATGAAAFSMNASGPLSAPDVSLTVTSDSIAAMQREITGLTVTATGKADLANPAAAVSLTGTVAGAALDGKATLSTAGGRREVKNLSLALGQNRVSGDLVLDQSFRPLGTLDLAFADIAPLAAMANQTAQGDMNGTIRFAEAGGAPEIALDGKASAITREDLTVRDVSISAVVADYLATPVISGKVQAATLTAGNTVVREIDVALRRDGVWTGFDGGAIVSGIPARAAGRLQIADGGVAIELSSGEAALQDFKATLAQPSTIRIAGGTATLDALTLEVAGGTAVLSGAAGAALDLTATFSAPQDGAPLTFGGSDNPINLTIKSASVRATGNAAEPRLDIATLLSKVSTNSASLDNLALTLHSDSFNIGNRAGPVNGSATADAFVVDNASIAPLVSGKLRAELAGTLSTDALSVASGTLHSDALDGAFSGDVSLADGSITMQLKADAVSAALPAPVRGVLAERTAISAKLGRDAAGGFSAETVSIVSGALNASGNARLDDKGVDATLSGALADVSLLAKDARGAIEFALTAKGEISGPDISLTVTSDRIEAAQREISDLRLIATGKADLANPAADVTLTGTLAGQSLDGKASLSTVSGRREIKGLSLALGQNRVSGDLVLDQNFRPLGTLDLAFADIAPLAALANQTAQGDMNGTIRFAEAGGTPQIALDGKASAITREDLSVQDVSISAVVADYLAAPVISGKVQAATLTAGKTVVRDIDVALRRDGVWTGFDGGAIVSGIPARAAGRLQIADGGVAIELSSGEAALQDFKATLAQPSTIRIAGGTTTLDALTLEVAGGTAVLSGAAGAALDLTATFSAPQDGAPLTFGGSDNPINLTIKSASVRATGNAAEPRLDIATLLSKVSTNSASLDNLALTLHSDSFNIGNRAGPVNGSATADAFVVDNASIAPLVSGKLRAELAGTLSTDALTVASGTLHSDALDGAFNGDVSLADGSITMQLKTDVVSAALPAPVRGVLAERTAISAKLGRDAAGGFSAETVSIVSGALNASGNARLGDKGVDATLSGALADVSLLAKDARGAIEFALTARGELSAPDVSLTVTSDRIEAAQREISNLKLIATGKADLANPAADVTLTGTVAGAALDGKATLSTAGGKREVKNLSLALGKNRISGDLVLDEKFLPLGTVSFQIPDLGSIAALALETASGDLNGTIRFAESDGRPELTVDARTVAISRRDVAAKNVSISAVVSDYISAPAISGRIRAATVTSGTTVARDIDVTLTRDGVWTGFDGGATVSDIPARASGRLQIAGGRTVIELASGTATVQGVNAALARPSTIEIANGTATLNQLAIGLGGGTAVVSGTAGSALNLNATLSAIPASIANSFSPGLAAAGSISGTARVTGAASSPAVGYSIDWSGAQTAQTRSAGFGAMSVTSSGDFAGRRLQFQANVGDGSGLGLRGGGSVDTGSRALSLDFSGAVPFSFLTQRLAAQGLALSGAANVSLQVRGTTNSPVIGGSASTSGARFVAAQSGIAINDIRAEIAIGGGVATIRTLNGALSTGGRISASGTVGIDPAKGFPANLALKIENGRYTDGRVVTTTMSGDLTLRGPLVSAPTLSGTVNLARTVITVPERLPGSLAALDVKHKNASAAVLAQQQALAPASQSSGGTGALTLDLTVNANNQIFVTGRGLDAELGGSLRLTGSTAAPRAAGQFTLRRGRLSILGRRLNFTRGTISFSGSLVPNLDLSADSTAGNTTVTVTVTGPANNPKFAFTSVPALPEDEVLARLIFGRSMSNLSPLQIAQLADAAAQLSGAGGSTSLLERLRSNLGVDDLDVRTDEQGGTSVAVGKYLNDRTYLSLEKGDKAGSGKATIDLNVGRGVKLRGEAREDGQAKGGIFFEREY